MSYVCPSVNFVSRTAFNNGVSDRVDKIENIEPFKAGAITLAFGGSVGSTFLQEADFYTGQNVGVIEFDKSVSNNAKLYIVSCIKKVCKQRFIAFSDEINKHFKNDLLIELPIQTDENNQPIIDEERKFHPDGYIPNWDYMEKYIKAIEKVVIADVVKFKDIMLEKTKEIVAH